MYKYSNVISEINENAIAEGTFCCGRNNNFGPSYPLPEEISHSL